MPSIGACPGFPLVKLFPRFRSLRSGLAISPGYVLGVSLLALVLGAACEDTSRLSPVAPGPAGLVDPSLAADVGLKWSPYVGVHIDGRAIDAYRDALSSLRRAGRVNGLRVEINKSNQNAGDRTIKAIGGLGLELLGLIGNEYLFEQNIEREIDGIFAAYPEIRYFQIGNETTTILPSTGPTISIEQYMAVFQRVYNHVQSRHPGRAILLTQSTLGSGLYGPSELETMATMGLTEMDAEKVIIAVNAYEPEARASTAAFSVVP